MNREIQKMYPLYRNAFCMGMALITLLLGCIGGDEVTGNSVDTGNPIVVSSSVLDSNGKGMAGVEVGLYLPDETEPMYSTTTDEDGKYSVPVTEGTYNIWLVKDGLVSYSDSVRLSKSRELNDTLRPASTLHAFLQMQPNHDCRTAVIHILGSNRYANAEEDCSFKIDGITKGEFQLEIESTEEGYTKTYSDLRILENTDYFLPEPIELIYTGIPVVENIEAHFDSVRGLVQLNWDESKFKNFGDYAVYEVKDMEPILLEYTESTKYSFKPGRTGTLTLGVRVRNKNFEEGELFETVAIQSVAPMPLKVSTIAPPRALPGKPVVLKGITEGLRPVVEKGWKCDGSDQWLPQIGDEIEIITPEVEEQEFACTFKAETNDGQVKSLKTTIHLSSWMEEKLLPIPLKLHESLVIDEMLYSFGGYSMQSSYEGVVINKRVMLTYNEADSVWSVEDKLPVGAVHHSVETIFKKVYLIGGGTHYGVVNDRVREFDPSTGDWTTKAHLPFAYSKSNTVEASGKIYAVAGTYVVNGITRTTSSAHVYDPIGDSWSSIAAFPFAVEEVELAYDSKGGIWGFTQDSLFLYDLAQNVWESYPLPKAFESSIQSFTAYGKVYVIEESSSNIYRLDPAAKELHHVGNIPTPRFDFALAQSDSKLYLSGGYILHDGIGEIIGQKVLSIALESIDSW